MKDLNIAVQLRDISFVRKTIEQIEKDFNRSNIEIKFHESTSRESIEKAILNVISKLPMEKLKELIYLIDIPEVEFRKAQGLKYFYNTLSEKILRREALKVFLRNKFS
jgi:hypothetical protein